MLLDNWMHRWKVFFRRCVSSRFVEQAEAWCLNNLDSFDIIMVSKLPVVVKLYYTHYLQSARRK